MKSLKFNIILNFINTFTGIIFPLITFPYAARVLLPGGIGSANFLNSIINYIILFTSLGIPLYAVREVARFRDDKTLRDKITIEITLLSILLCLGGYIVVVLLAYLVPQISHQAKLFYILSLGIIFTAIGVNWFYQAIEDFTFITIRGLIVRTACAISLFIFVKSPDDLLAYGWIIVGYTVGNNLLNFVHMFKLISLKGLSYGDLHILRHLKPTFKIFFLNLIISIYVNLNIVMLGLMQTDAAVGIFTAGDKISHTVLTLVTSIGAVMLPRCSNLISTNQINEFIELIRKALYLVIGFSLPCMIGLIFLSSPLISIFCGQAFISADIVLALTAPVIFIIGVSNIIGIQVLYPLGKENLVILSTIGGALTNLIINFLLIPKLSYTGASISTLVAESIVTIIQISFTVRIIPELWKKFNIYNYIVGTLLMLMGIIAIKQLLYGLSDILICIIVIVCATTIYGCYLIYRQDVMVTMLASILKNGKTRLCN